MDFAFGTLLFLVQAIPADHGLVAFDGFELNRLAGLEPRATLDLAAGETATLDLSAGSSFYAAGLWWSGDLGTAEIRIVDASGVADPWFPLVEDLDQSPAVVGARRPAGSKKVAALTSALHAEGASVSLRVHGPCSIEHLTLVWIATPNPLAQPKNSGPLAAGSGYPKPNVHPRSSWGAAPPSCSPGYCSTTHIGIHHSASASQFQSTSFAQCAANVKSIQTYHMVTNGWCDIGYNYLACVHGDLFEGRAGGDDVKGAHDGFNCGSMGVCAMGYFHSPYNQTPTPAMRQAIEELSAWKCSQQGIDPKGASYYAGYGGVVNNVYGHRDVKSTACPGDLLYNMLPQIKDGIAALLSGGGGAAGTLKGVLYNAAVGTNARISGGTVSLADGTFVVTGSTGYYEFPLPAGSVKLAATAPGYKAAWSQDTVTSGDVWESIGLWPAATPAQTAIPLGNGQFACTWKGDPGTVVFLLFAATPLIPLFDAGSYGMLWPNANSLGVAPLGVVPGSGTLAKTLQAPNVPGLRFHIQGLVTSGGQPRLTNGNGLLVQ